MMSCRGMGAISSKKVPRAKRRGDDKPVKTFREGGSVADLSPSELNRRVMKALISRYGSESVARNVFRDTGTGQLLQIMEEEEAKAGR